MIRKVTKSTGIITTVAGITYNKTLVNGYFGDGGLATNAALYYPYGVAVDAVGNIYIADSDNIMIRMVSTSGYISTVADGVTSGFQDPRNVPEFGSPGGVAVDTIGNVYIADAYNQRIRIIALAPTSAPTSAPTAAPTSAPTAKQQRCKYQQPRPRRQQCSRQC